MANDTEYKAIKRRMSKVRAQRRKGDLQEGDDDATDESGFKDLIKYWKKHGIPISKDIISDMADENVKMARAKGQGRRRSRELEELHKCVAIGPFSLDNLDETDENIDSTPNLMKKPTFRNRTASVGTNKAKGSSLKKKGLQPSINGTSSPSTNKKLIRSISNK